MGFKVQSALEYLTSYSWALIILVVVVVSYFLITYNSSGTTFSPSYCYISAGLPCYQLVVSTNSLGSMAILLFTNDLGKTIYFKPTSSFYLKLTATTQYASGSCTPLTATSGTPITCVVYILGYTPQLGAQLEPQFFFNYSECVSSNCNSKNSLLVLSTAGSSVSYAYPANILLEEGIINIPPGGTPTIIPPGGGAPTYSTTTTLGPGSTTTTLGPASTTTVPGQGSTTTYISTSSSSSSSSTSTSTSSSSSSSSSSTSTSTSSSSSSSALSSIPFPTSTSTISTTTVPGVIVMPVCPTNNTYVYYPGDFNSSNVDFYVQGGGLVERNSSVSYVADEQHNNIAQLITLNSSHFNFNGAYYNKNQQGQGISSYIQNGYLYTLIYAKNGSSGISIVNTTNYGLYGTILNNLNTFEGYVPDYITVGKNGKVYVIYNSTSTSSPSIIAAAIASTAGQYVISNNKNYYLQSSDIVSVNINSTNIGNVGDVAGAVLYQNTTEITANPSKYLNILMGTTDISNPSPTLIVVNFTGSSHSIYNVVNIYPEQPNGAIVLANGGANAYFTAGNNLIEIGTIPSQNSQITNFIPVSNLPYNLTGIAMSSNGIGAYADDVAGNLFSINLQSQNSTLIKTSGDKFNGKLALSTDNKQLYGYNVSHTTYFTYIFPIVMNTSNNVISKLKNLRQYSTYSDRQYLGLKTSQDISLACVNQDNYYALYTGYGTNGPGTITNANNYTILETAYNYNITPKLSFPDKLNTSMLSTNPQNNWLYGILANTENTISLFINGDYTGYTNVTLYGINMQTGAIATQNIKNRQVIEYTLNQQEAFPSTDGSNEYFFVANRNLTFGPAQSYTLSTPPIKCPDSNVYCSNGGPLTIQNFSGNTSAVFFKNTLGNLCSAINACSSLFVSILPGMDINLTEINYTYAQNPSSSSNFYILSAPSNMGSVSSIVNLRQAVDNYAQNYLGIINPEVNISFGGYENNYRNYWSSPDSTISGSLPPPTFAGESSQTLYVFLPLDFYGSLYVAGNSSIPFGGSSLYNIPYDSGGYLYPYANYTYTTLTQTATSYLNTYNNCPSTILPGQSCSSQYLQNLYTNYTMYINQAHKWKGYVATLENDYNNYYLPNNKNNLTYYTFNPTSFLLSSLYNPTNDFYSSGLTGFYELQISPLTGEVTSMIKIKQLTNQTVTDISIDPYNNEGYVLTYTEPSSYYIPYPYTPSNPTFILYSFSLSNPTLTKILSIPNQAYTSIQFLPNNELYLSAGDGGDSAIYNLTNNKLYEYNQNQLCNNDYSTAIFQTTDNNFLYCNNVEYSVHDLIYNRLNSSLIYFNNNYSFFYKYGGIPIVFGLTQQTEPKT